MIINDRRDLDLLAATDPATHAGFIAALRAAASRRQDVATYPPGYGDRDYAGPAVAADWQLVIDVPVLERFGYESLDQLPAP